MTRLPPLQPHQLDASQQAMIERLRTVMPGVGVSGSFGSWVRLPEIGPSIIEMFVASYKHRKVDRRLFELMTLVVSQHWRAAFAWEAHAKLAQRSGIAEEIIEAVRIGTTPTFKDAEEQVVYDVTRQIVETRSLDDPTFKRAQDTLGPNLLNELLTEIGMYLMVSVMLVGFAMPARDGKDPFATS